MDIINNVNSGVPINLTYSPNPFQQVSPLVTQRPNQKGNPVIPKGQRTKVSGNQSLFGLINPLATPGVVSPVSLPDNNTPYGTAGRNSVRFDPYFDTDLGVHKNFALMREGLSFDFRAEAFNVFNVTNYAVPASNYGTSTFGAVTSASTFPARVLQFAGKIIF